MKTLLSIDNIRTYVTAAIRSRLNRWMNTTNTSRTALADRAGVAHTDMSRLMGDAYKPIKRGPALYTLVQIALATGMSLDELCGLDTLREQMGR
jgi:hypothetical protein